MTRRGRRRAVGWRCSGSVRGAARHERYALTGPSRRRVPECVSWASAVTARETAQLSITTTTITDTQRRAAPGAAPSTARRRSRLGMRGAHAAQLRADGAIFQEAGRRFTAAPRRRAATAGRPTAGRPPVGSRPSEGTGRALELGVYFRVGRR